MIYPLWNVIMISLVDYETYLESSALLIPKRINIDAYKFIFATDDIVNSLFISFINTVLGTSYNLFLTITLAYGLSFPKLPGKKIFITYVLIPFFFSGGLIPLYMQVRALGLMNTIFSLFIPLGINGWFLIIIKNYFSEIPESMREAATIDGANDITILFRIILPLSKAMLATFLLFYAVMRWNEWFFAMLFITDPNKVPLQKVLRDIVFNNFGGGGMQAAFRNLTGSYVTGKAVKMATAVIATLPILSVYPFLQKHFVKGVMTGAIKF